MVLKWSNYAIYGPGRARHPREGARRRGPKRHLFAAQCLYRGTPLARSVFLNRYSFGKASSHGPVICCLPRAASRTSRAGTTTPRRRTNAAYAYASIASCDATMMKAMT